jgi:hypothetical protein
MFQRNLHGRRWRQQVPLKRPYQTTYCHIQRNNNPKNEHCFYFSAFKDLIQADNFGEGGKNYLKCISPFCPQVQTPKLWDQFRLNWVWLAYGKSCLELFNFSSLFTVMSPLMHHLQIPLLHNICKIRARLA